jgi:hypothetical protein
MEKSLGYLKILVLSGLFSTGSFFNILKAQNTKQDKQVAKETAIKEMVNAQRYVFEAQSATTMKGRVRQLTPDYDLVIKKDTIDAYLPYFGEAYTATIGGSDEGGIKFTSTDFDYKIEEGKKGGWDVTIKPKNIKDVSMMTLSISASGYGTLQVNSNTRQMISFYGYIESVKPR